MGWRNFLNGTDLTPPPRDILQKDMMASYFSQLLNSAKKILIRIGRIQTMIIMSLFYYLILGPMAILYQIFHRQKQSGQTYWIKKQPIQDMDLYLTRQF